MKNLDNIFLIACGFIGGVLFSVTMHHIADQEVYFFDKRIDGVTTHCVEVKYMTSHKINCQTEKDEFIIER